MFTLKSRWSPKLPGLELVTKKFGFSSSKWVPLSFLFNRSLYSLIIAKDFIEAFIRILDYLGVYGGDKQTWG